ncbi:flagellar hook-length control protein FliK [Fusibacter ferrireducens]|uniref:Flagellar hook-length control protein FliK n=1 Tax=Fusibacter ferrireducens TaxID=2785058 RepID=A0ABR9ZNM4_9FIRM|nr:flagellar hook-length control protein FliK [Fusibacter ferrireducens]MBF4691728.1 flagellar hook-length control protein FliK [Fusibacter ferrireducens]
MYTRELQNNMSILNLFKQTGQDNKEIKTTNFSDIIGKKYQNSALLNQNSVSFYNKQADHMSKSTFKTMNSNQYQKNTESLNGNKPYDDDVKNVKLDVKPNVATVANPDVKSNTKSDAKSDTKADSTHSKTDVKATESKDSKTNDLDVDEAQAAKDSLAEKLKVTAEELDQLMALLDLDLTELQQLVNSEMVRVELLQDVCTTLSQIEISSSLDGASHPDKTLVDKLASQLKSLMTSLQNQQTGINEGPDNSVNKFIEKLETLLNPTDQSDEKMADEQATQGVVLSEEETQMLSDKIRNLMDKSVDKFSDSEVKASTAKADAQSVSQPETGVKTESVEKIISSKPMDMSADDNSKGNASEHKAEQLETVVSVSNEGDLVVTKGNSETGSAFDQIILKQSSSITHGTQTSASATLRSSIFSQIMDAVQTNIKLDENGSHMLMKLNPEQLGSVELKLSIHKGVVLAEINVENEMVKATVESNLDDLKQSLSQKGYQLNQINVSIDSGKKEQEQQFAFNKGAKPKRGLAVEEVGDLEALHLENANYRDDPYDTSTINYYA